MATPDKATPSFHQQLESLLREQLRIHPRNHAARLKLLELYFETQRAGPFLAMAQELENQTVDKATSPEWQKCLSMGRMLLPESPLFTTEGSDRIEFVGAGPGAAAPPPVQVRRLGDDERFAPLFKALGQDFDGVRADTAFLARLDLELAYLARRPSALLHARRLSERLGGAQIYIKREDTSPRDTHLIVSVVGQALLAQRLGRKTLVTSTIDGRRGVVTASIAARLGLEAMVFADVGRNARLDSNLMRMRLLGAQVTPVTDWAKGTRDAREGALQYWMRQPERALMVFGLEGAPEPYPLMAREFSATIGRECQRQLRLAAKRPADLLVARGGHNADALGLFPPFLAERGTRLVCVEPAEGPLESVTSDPTRQPMNASEHKVAQGILEGMEYPSVVREQRWLRETGRVEYRTAGIEQAKQAIRDLSLCEGLIPAIETAYALGWACEAAAAMPQDHAVVVAMAEDADKDAWDMARLMGDAP
jgi:tryptophan synthase beta chain